MSKYKVLIPDCIVRNEEGININSKEFLLYYYLKILHDKQKQGLTVKFNHNKFMCSYQIKTNSTLKTMLQSLHTNGLIMTSVSEFPRHGLLNITLNEEYIQKQPFTMLHINLYYLIPRVGHEGLRLMYYYESRINRKKDDHQFCFAGVRTIAHDTKINKNKIKDVNELLVKAKILRIEKHVLEKDGSYDEFIQERVTKFNNHCNPQIHKLETYNFQNKKVQTTGMSN